MYTLLKWGTRISWLSKVPFIKVIFFIIGTFILRYAILKFDQLNEAQLISLLTYSIIMFLFCFIERLSEFSVFGLKAQLRDKIYEADKTIKNLQELTRLLVEPTAYIVSGLRFSEGFSDEQKLEFRKEATNLMREIGIEEQDIKDSFYYFDKFRIFDLLTVAKKPLRDLVFSKREDKNNGADIDKYLQQLDKELNNLDHCFEAYNVLLKKINDCPFISDNERNQLLKNPHIKNLKSHCKHK